jgi:sulfate permease, SulP family
MERIRGLIAPACTIALLGSIESLLSAVVADGLINDRHNANTELIAQGLANIACPFFCGLPATGAIARTSANIRSGGTTPVSGSCTRSRCSLIVLAFSRYGQFVPMAAIGAVLIMVALRMGEWHELARLRQMPRSDAVVLVATMALTVVFDLDGGGAGGDGPGRGPLHPADRRDDRGLPRHLQRRAGDPGAGGARQGHPEGVLVYRIFGPFFFGAAEKMEDALERDGEAAARLILRMQLVPAMDATASTPSRASSSGSRPRGASSS